MTGYIYTWNEREFMKRNKTSGVTEAKWTPDRKRLQVKLDDGGRFSLSPAFLAIHGVLRWDTAEAILQPAPAN